MLEEKDKKKKQKSDAGSESPAKKTAPKVTSKEKTEKKAAVKQTGIEKIKPKKKKKDDTAEVSAEKKIKKAESKKTKAEVKKPKKETKKPVEKKKEAKAEAKPEKTKPEKTVKQEEYIPRLLLKYKNEIVPQMMKLFKCKNVFEVPKVTKITINTGMGKALQNNKLLDAAVDDLAVISGQKPIVTVAKRAVSNFKLRMGNPIGCKVTLRRLRMYEFLERFITIAIPRIRDFRGVSDKSFDGFGNYSVGIKEQIIFPEIDYDKVESIHGMDINIVTNAKNDEEARTLLKLLGMPFVESAEADVSA